MSIFSVLKTDKNIIAYRPEFTLITGNINTAILLNQMIYRYYDKYGVGERFYKFVSPCKHDDYRHGDSWTEELGFTVREFNGALKKIGFKYGDIHNEIEENQALVFYQKDGNGKTHYWLNESLLEEKLDELYQDLNRIAVSMKKPDTEYTEPPLKKKLKKEFHKDFEVLWQLYDKKTSNKQKSYQYWNGMIKAEYEHPQVIEAIKQYKLVTDPTFVKNFEGFLNGLIDSFIPKKAWIIDGNGKRWTGVYYDSQNKFEAESGMKTTIQSSMVAKYIEDERFGYIW